MLATKCPGQDMRYWTAEDIHEEKCPHCGEMIEFWKTDIRLRCPNCRSRVANPGFNMGCAEWCAYAEQCLGQAARGLKTKSLKTILEDEITRLAGNKPEVAEKGRALMNRAEEHCRLEKVEPLPVLTAVLYFFLNEQGLLDNPSALLESLGEAGNFPRAALDDARRMISSLGQVKLNGKPEKIVSALVAGRPA